MLAERIPRVGAPRDDADERVSREVVPCSDASFAEWGIGDMVSPGDSKPFFVVAPFERELSENRPLAFGADATRRINRDAPAPMAFGESGPVRVGVEGVGGMKESCEEFVV